MTKPRYPSTSAEPRHSHRAFSLLELLVTISIIAILSAAGATILGSGLRKPSLSVAGNKMAGMVENAQQKAITQNTATAVIVVTKPGYALSYRLMTVLVLDAQTDTWKQTSPWELLPEGVLVDPDPAKSSFLTPPGALLTLPVLTREGATFDPQAGGYAYRVFTSSGVPYENNAPITMRLIHGIQGVSGEVTATDNGQNFFEVIVAEATGRIRVVRP
ncbi:MAG: pilus assembly FimT family protein [Terrimicrobiaceae bacterium]